VRGLGCARTGDQPYPTGPEWPKNNIERSLNFLSRGSPQGPDYGPRGREAISRLLKEGNRAGIVPDFGDVEFVTARN